MILLSNLLLSLTESIFSEANTTDTTVTFRGTSNTTSYVKASEEEGLNATLFTGLILVGSFLGSLILICVLGYLYTWCCHKKVKSKYGYRIEALKKRNRIMKIVFDKLDELVIFYFLII